MIGAKVRARCGHHILSMLVQCWPQYFCLGFLLQNNGIRQNKGPSPRRASLQGSPLLQASKRGKYFELEIQVHWNVPHCMISLGT